MNKRDIQACFHTYNLQKFGHQNIQNWCVVNIRENLSLLQNLLQNADEQWEVCQEDWIAK